MSEDDKPQKDKDIEEAFKLLRTGKEDEAKLQFWNAADKYAKAMKILEKLAEVQPKETDDDKQIAKLYEQKRAEYTAKARKCLIEAMQQDSGKQQPTDEAAPSSLSDEEATMRTETFCTLFSKMPAGLVTGDGENGTDQQWSLEERLQELNASLPSGFKTSEERMNEINRGLRKLGLSLYDQQPAYKKFMEELPKSEDDQVEDIIAQATDEVSFQKNVGEVTTVSDSAAVPKKQISFDDENISDDDDDDDDEDDEETDILDNDNIYAIKKIRKAATQAQAKLAELVAYLDEAKEAIKKAEEDDLETSDDEEGKESDSNNRIEAALVPAKNKLTGARKKLNKAVGIWKDELSLEMP